MTAILDIVHVTTYRYRQAVRFGEHIMMLRPRDDRDQSVLHAEIDIDPRPSKLLWSRDGLGNHVATAAFEDRSAELRFASRARVEHSPLDIRSVAIASYARRYPFAYRGSDRIAAEPFLDADPGDDAVARWARRFLGTDGAADTRALLAGMTGTIHREFRHGARHEKGIRPPAETLSIGGGSCRDLAVMMIAALRALGLAARFVSGYLRVSDDDPATLRGGNTHAWAQVHVPGPGWVDLDPSSGATGNHDLVRVAVVSDPVAAIPLRGTWFGVADDHIGMEVAVKVTRNAGLDG